MRVRLSLAALLLAVPALSQPGTMELVSRTEPQHVLFAGLPAADGTEGLRMVTDCLTTDCNAGGGVLNVLMYDDGDSWEPVASGGAAHGDGANCAAGEIALGVDASGAVQGCYEPTEADISDLVHTTDTTCNDVGVACLFAGAAAEGGAATTATALAANGANCSAGNYPLGVDASGAAESCTADDDVPESGDFGAADDLDASGNILADILLESMLKVVDAASDEECLTYEATVGDFEWQACGGGGGLWTDDGDNTMSSDTYTEVTVLGADNDISIAGSSTGNAASITTSGSDADISLDLTLKGGGNLDISGGISVPQGLGTPTPSTDYVKVGGYTIHDWAGLGLMINGGSTGWLFFNDAMIRGEHANSAGMILGSGTTATVPTLLPDYTDADTGVCSPADDQVSMCAGAVEGIRVTESGAAITAIDLKGPTDVTGVLSQSGNIGADPPSTCKAGTFWIDTDETDDTNCTTTNDDSLCLCVATDTWVAFENN